jgi:peptidylprolyl isomerase
LLDHMYDIHAVVFGSVVEGLDVVRTVEGVGSSSGATRSKVVIEASGQL